jgi:hypothetical protein
MPKIITADILRSMLAKPIAQIDAGILFLKFFIILLIKKGYGQMD